MSEIDEDTCTCFGCGSINIGYSMDECTEGCPECGSMDIMSYGDSVQEAEESQQAYENQGGY